MGQGERARGRGKGQTPVWGRAHAARDPPSAHGHSSSSASAVLDFPIPFRFDETFWARTAVSMHETHMTQRNPDFSEQSGNAHPHVHPSLPLVSLKFPLRPIEPSAIISLIFSRWGIQGNQSAGYPEGTRKPARGYPKGKRKLLERQSPGNPKAPALMSSPNSRGKESTAQGAVEKGVGVTFRPPEFY